MWSLGRNVIRLGNELVPAVASGPTLDHSPRQCVRAAAYAPQPPAQLAKGGGATIEFSIRSALSSEALRRRPAHPSGHEHPAGREVRSETAGGEAPRLPAPNYQRRCRHRAFDIELPVPTVRVRAALADESEPRASRAEGGATEPRPPAPATPGASGGPKPLPQPSQGAAAAPPSQPSSSNPYLADAEALIRAIAGLPPAHAPEGGALTALYHLRSIAGLAPSGSPAGSGGIGATSGSTVALLRALDAMPDAGSSSSSSSRGSSSSSSSRGSSRGPATSTADRQTAWSGSGAAAGSEATSGGGGDTPSHLPGVLISLLAAIAPNSPLYHPHIGPRGTAPYGSENDSLYPPGASSGAVPAAAAAERPAWEQGQEGGQAQQQQGQQRLGQSLMGPGRTARGRAAAALVFEAAGVALPPWAPSVLPPPPAPGLRLDPALEWALEVLSHNVTLSEPGQGALRLANRTLAAHLGPPLQPRPPGGDRGGAGAGAAAGRRWRRRRLGQGLRTGDAGGGGGGEGASAAVMPWPLLLPLLEAIGGRLSPPAALALLRGVVRQVSPEWRVALPARQQPHLVATLRAVFGAALRRPAAVSPSVAAGLMAVMARLRLRSSPACSLLVGRILAAVAPPGNATPGAARAAEQPPPGSPARAAQAPPGGIRPAAYTGTGTAASAIAIARAGKRANREPQCRLRRTVSEPLCQSRLRWVCVALSALARLRMVSAPLPRRAVSKLLWAALHGSDLWRPAHASALLLWASRLRSRPSAAFLHHYSRLLLLGRWRRDVAGRMRPAGAPRPGGRTSRRTKSSQLMGDVPRVLEQQQQQQAGPPPSGLLDRMTGEQVGLALEALVALYGPCAPALPPPRSYDSSAAERNGGGAVAGPREGPSAELVCALAAALTERLHQLKRRQLCRLPLLLRRLGRLGHEHQVLLMQRGAQWPQAFVLRVRQLLPACDPVDVMLLLRGLAATARTSSQPQDAAASYATCTTPYAVWIGTELADDALRRYLVVLPSASLYHTAHVMESLALLWEQQPQQQPQQQPWEGGRGAPSVALRGAAAAAEGRRRTGATAGAMVPAIAAGSSASAAWGAWAAAVPPSAEADLRRRRQTDLASERDFLLQQLDEHVAECLSYSGGVIGVGGGGHGAYAPRGGGGGGAAEWGAGGPHEAARLAAKLLASYSGLRRPPPERLQSLLEGALVAQAGALDTSSWAKVREAYQAMGLQPGRDLSVALVTFA